MRRQVYEVIRADTEEVMGQGYDSPRDARESAEHYAEVLKTRCLAVEILEEGKFTSHVAEPPGEESQEALGEGQR